MTLRRFSLRVLIPLVLVAGLGFGVWSAFSAMRVASDLRGALDDATALQNAVRAGDDTGADQALAAMRADVAAARDRTDGATWSVLTRIPGLGDDARGVRVATQVVADLTDAAEPLVRKSGDLDALVPRDGRVPLKPLANLQQPIARAAADFAAARDLLATENPAGFVAPLQDRYVELTDRVTGLADALGAADKAVRLMPGMLGGQGERDYLLVFQNNAESRSTGGLPGAASLISASGGRLTLGQQVTGSSFGATDAPVLPLTPAEREIYGPQLGTYFLDANFTPDFPRAAELFRAHWEREYDAVDGVVAVDPIAVSYLLEATGPVSVDGIELNAGNVVDELLSRTYFRVTDPAAQDDFFDDVAAAVFDKITSGGADPRRVLEALGRGGEERRLLVHSFEGGEQEVLSGTAVAGELFGASDDTRPRVGVYVNDNTGSKMSYYLRSKSWVTATECSDGVQTLTGGTTFTSLAPPDAATSLPGYVTGGGAFGIDPGDQLVAIRFYAPVEGSLEEVAQDGDVFKDLPIVDHQGREAGTTYVLLGPGDTAEMTWRMTTGPGQTGDVELQTTPGVEPGPSSSNSASAC